MYLRNCSPAGDQAEPYLYKQEGRVVLCSLATFRRAELNFILGPSLAKGKKDNQQKKEHNLPKTTHNLRPTVSRELHQQKIPVFKYLHTGTKPKDKSCGEKICANRIVDINTVREIDGFSVPETCLVSEFSSVQSIQYPVPHSLKTLNLAIIPIIIYCNLIFQLI